MPVLADHSLDMYSPTPHTAKASSGNYTPLSIPPEGYYGYNRQVLSFSLDLDTITAIPRCSLSRSQPFDIVFVASAPSSYDVMDTVASAGVQAFIRMLRQLRESLPAIKSSRIGLVYLCSVPNLPGQSVIECDSDDPVTAANVDQNFADLDDTLVSASTRYIPVGQAALNVLQRYKIPGPLADDPDFFVLDLLELAMKTKD